MLRVFGLALVLFCGAFGLAGAQPAPAPVPAAAPAQPVLDRETADQLIADLQDPHKRAKLIAALRALATVSGATKPAPVAPVAPTPLTSAIPLAPNSLGAQVLVDASSRLQQGSKRLVQSVQTVTDFQQITDWLRETAVDPAAQARFFAALWRLALILAIGFAGDIIAERLLRRSRERLEAMVVAGAKATEAASDDDTLAARGAPLAAIATETAATETADEPLAAELESETGTPVIAIPLARLPLVLVRLLLELIPAIILLGFVYGLLSTPLAGRASTQVIIMAVVDAFVLVQVVMAAVRSLISPHHRGLRVFGIGDAAAIAITHWVRRLVVVSVFGYALAEVGLIFGLDPDAHDALLKIVALIVHVMLVVIVFKNRKIVAGWIAPVKDDGGPIALARRRAARLWHHVAIIAILALWLVWALGVPDGYRLLLESAALSLVILGAGRAARQILLGSLDRLFHVGAEPIAGLEVVPGLAGLSARARSYYRLLRTIVSAIITAVITVFLLQVWGFGAFDWFSDGALGGRVVSALLTVSLILFLVLAVWEGVNELILRRINRLSDQGHVARASRVRTLLPMIRAALAVILFLIAGPVALSEIGVNIAPLLAGAGIVGVAIGFGSQKLVQDLITGVFLLLENAMQVGDWVTLAGVSGSVEALSVRTIRLRASDGSVHIIPFSAVTTVNNSNRGLGNAAVSVSVAYKEDTDRVCSALREVADGMRKDPAFQRGMLSDLQLWGVDKIEGAVVTIAGQIVCTDKARWGVQREFHRRMKKRFEELGIEIANPTQTVMLVTQAERAAPAEEAPQPQRQEAAQ